MSLKEKVRTSIVVAGLAGALISGVGLSYYIIINPIEPPELIIRSNLLENQLGGYISVDDIINNEDIRNYYVGIRQEYDKLTSDPIFISIQNDYNQKLDHINEVEKNLLLALGFSVFSTLGGIFLSGGKNES